ncbi:MAG: pilus assembly protein PilM [bacterium]
MLSFSRTSFLGRYFPPPSFLTMPAAGVDLSYHSMRVVTFVRSHKGLALDKAVTRSIPGGAIYGDEVQSNKELKDALIAVKKDLGLSFVRVTLPEDKAYIFRTILPHMPPAQARQAIEFQLEENVPLLPSEAVFDFVILPSKTAIPAPTSASTPTDTSAATMDVVVAVFPKKFVEGYLELFRSAGLMPTAFYMNTDAIAKSVIRQDDMGTYLITNIGTKTTGIYVVSEGVVQFTATLSFGGESLTSAIEKHLSVTHEEALKIKRGEVMMKNREAVELFYSLANTASALRDEMNRIVSYWQTHKDKGVAVGKPIQKIYLCGSGAHLCGFDEYISTTMKIETEVGNVWQNAFTFEESIPHITQPDSLSYASAIGSALASFNSPQSNV